MCRLRPSLREGAHLGVGQQVVPVCVKVECPNDLLLKIRFTTPVLKSVVFMTSQFVLDLSHAFHHTYSPVECRCPRWLSIQIRHIARYRHRPEVLTVAVPPLILIKRTKAKATGIFVVGSGDLEDLEIASIAAASDVLERLEVM